MTGNYFIDCYLKRMNKDGTTIQERVRTSKEREFDKIKMPKSKYLACIYQLNGEPIEILCNIQPAKWKQEQILSNILCSTSAQKFKTGDILRTFQKVKDAELDEFYIIMMVSEDLSHGYQKYEAIKLDSFINNTDDYGDTIRTNSLPMVLFLIGSRQPIESLLLKMKTSCRRTCILITRVEDGKQLVKII